MKQLQIKNDKILQNQILESKKKEENMWEQHEKSIKQHLEDSKK